MLIEKGNKMKNITRHTGTLEMIKRLPNSLNGNPRFKLRCDGWTFSTTPDSMNGYVVENYVGKEVIVTLGTHYNQCQLDTIKCAKLHNELELTEVTHTITIPSKQYSLHTKRYSLICKP